MVFVCTYLYRLYQVVDNDSHEPSQWQPGIRTQGPNAPN